MKCLNLPRFAVEGWKTKCNPEKVAWISIGEPETSFDHVHNPILDKIPNLKISFQDLKRHQLEAGVCPPSLKFADKIVSFILRHPTKNFLVNCAAGVSRSGAICKFLEDYFNYKWVEFGKEIALPNNYLYELLEQVYIGRLMEMYEHQKEIE